MKRFGFFFRATLTAALILVGLFSGTARAAVSDLRRAATNEYHGVKVVDEYQWLENAADPAVREWSSGQSAKARAYLDKLSARADLEDRLTHLLTQPLTNYSGLSWRKGKLFLMKF